MSPARLRNISTTQIVKLLLSPVLGLSVPPGGVLGVLGLSSPGSGGSGSGSGVAPV